MQVRHDAQVCVLTWHLIGKAWLPILRRLPCILLQVRGKMSCLLINDIDAGLGHFANTQVGRACSAAISLQCTGTNLVVLVAVA